MLQLIDFVLYTEMNGHVMHEPLLTQHQPDNIQDEVKCKPKISKQTMIIQNNTFTIYGFVMMSNTDITITDYLVQIRESTTWSYHWTERADVQIV